MSSDALAIQAANLSKRFVLGTPSLERSARRLAARLGGRIGSGPAETSEHLALDDVSFAIGKGETVGIVGRNGSGKSTLLQIICGTLKPSSGQIGVTGRVAALLELGSGFNPDYSGRDNVFLNSAILGVPGAETRHRLDQILAFADIGKFIDQPVRTYSSGMFVRLAFATAINSDPDILIIDEALAVGDEAFQRKCFARLQQIQEQGATILFVSHSVQSIIALCDRAILLDAGRKLMEGDPKSVTAQYQRLIHAPASEVATIRRAIEAGAREPEPARASPSQAQARPQEEGAALPEGILPAEDSAFDPGLSPTSKVSFEANGGAIEKIRITDEDGRPVNILVHGGIFHLRFEAEFSHDFSDISFAMMIKTIVGEHLAGLWSHLAGEGLRVTAGDRFTVTVPFVNRFAPGTYFLNAGVFSRGNGDFTIVHRVLDALMFKVPVFEGSDLVRGSMSLRPDQASGVEDRAGEGTGIIVKRL